MGILRRIKKLVISCDSDGTSVEQMGSNHEIHDLSDSDGALENVDWSEVWQGAEITINIITPTPEKEG